ncbi:nucleolar protein 9 isoform X2 [Neoarius graeffei]|uniref:nucleolar protein 9 isoform X2 n=1 Tax=Neoarius graeffei TaxID=443677 RepID=UPI00298C9133|nr:nucleolar protein 9 isoform X2 [Neoarius graeffei]
MVEKMGAKGQKHFGDQAQKRTKKKPDRSKAGAGGGRSSRGEEGGKRKHLDSMTVSYFRRVSERLNEGFTNDEERELFVENVLSEVKGQADLVSTDMTGSLAVQRLLSLASPKQVAEVLAELGGETGSEFKTVSCDKCGGHVIESAVKQMAKWTEDGASEEKSSSGNEQEEPEPESCGTLEDQVLTLCRVVRENIVEFIKNPHGSHVLRTLVHVLAGCSVQEQSDASPAKKPKKAEPELTDFEAPTSFWWELKYLSESLMENVNVCVTNPTASTVLQTLLSICHRKRPILCKKLNKGIMGYLTSMSSAPGVSPLLVFLKDQLCSRLIQTMFQVSHKALIRDTYKNHLKDQLVPLALHPFANYPIQSLIAASVHCKVFLKIFDELMPGLEAILAAGHMGIIVQVVESCVHREEKQADILRHLLEAFHCSEPSTRLLSSLRLFLSILTYEVYFNTEAAEGNAVPQRPLSICYHGSRLVQALARFKDRSILMNSLHSLSSAELLSLGTEQTGSHALQALITLSSDKGKGKILRKFEGIYTQLACNKYGSRLLEAVWGSATISQRQSIAEQLENIYQGPDRFLHQADVEMN